MYPNRFRFMRLLIAICVSAAFLTAQMASPLPAISGSSMAGDEMRMMADGGPCPVPCCPDDTTSGDCGSCAFLCLSMPMVTLSPNLTGTLALRYPSRSAFVIPVDQIIVGLGQYPPDHPPRTNV